MNTKTLCILFLVMLFFAACKKDKNNNPLTNSTNNTNNYTSATKIILDTPVTSGNTIKLHWSKLKNDSLQASYYIIRVSDTTNTQYSMTYITVDTSVNEYTDTMLMTPYVQYYVVAELTPTSNPNAITSNKQTYVRTDINFMPISPTDALYDRSSRQLYIYNTAGSMMIYDLQSKTTIKQATLNANIGYCALGIYNGRKELYVPRTDGWLFIYDAATLEQVDQINIGGQLSCVVYNNGILFISGATVGSSYYSNIVSYNRATKSFISLASSNDQITRLKLVPGSNSQFYCVSNYSDAYYYTFDGQGNYVTQQTSYLSSSSLSASVFEVFPDGNDFITNTTGAIYSKNLTYVSSLPYGNISFTSFDFDNTNQLIYAGCSIKTIQAYSMSNYQLVKTINTQGYPLKVFYDNGAVISVSTTAGYLYPTTYSFVEQF